MTRHLTLLRCFRTLAAPLLLLTVSLVMGHPARAQSSAPIPQIAAQVNGYDGALRAIDAISHNPDLDDAALQAQAVKIPPIDKALDDIVVDLTTRLAAIDARLAELGAASKPGDPPETPEITQERGSLVAARNAIELELKQARVLTVVTDQLTTQLGDRRRELFSARLWSTSRSILDPRLWIDFARAVPADIARLQNLTTLQVLRLVTARRHPAELITWGIGALIAVLMIFPGVRVLTGIGDRYLVRIANMSRLRRALRAIWVVLVIATIPVLALSMVHMILDAGGALTVPVDAGVKVLIRVTRFAALFYGLGVALLAADKPVWRLAPVSDDLVARLRGHPLMLGIAVWLANAVAGLNSAFGLSLSASVVTDALTLLIELAVIGQILLIIAGEHQTANAERADGEAPSSKAPWVVAALACWVGLIGAAGAVVFGYLALATMIVREMVWISAILAGLFLCLRLANELFPAVLGSNGRLGRSIGSALGLSPSSLDQTGILLSGVAQLALWLFAWAAIVAPFGATSTNVLSQVGLTDLVFHLGTVSISPGTIIAGLILFMLGLLITRAIRGWVERRYLPSTNLDIGVRTSVSAGVSYLGGAVALMLASTYLGLSLDRIALLAGALSVGIGFGLQAVIGNFVSGLILLAERPVKVGDWIAIGDLEGDVKRINVRATEIEMRDRSRLIVPNSELVTKTVRNVTHGEALGRIRIVIKVNDDADVIALRTVLLAHLTNHEAVLKEPAPQVYFSDAQDGALEFTCFAYLPSPRQTYAARSDLLFEIIPDLREKGFVLSNSTPIVNVGIGDRPIEPSTPTP